MTASWHELVHAFALVLQGLEERTYLIISSATVNVYVQYAVDDNGLDAEAVADVFLPPDRKLGSSGIDAMRALGWIPPDSHPGGYNNWRRSIPWPGAGTDFHDLAVASTSVLHDIHRIPTIDDLRYTAWRDPERPPIGVTYYDDDFEPGTPVLHLPRLELAGIQPAPDT